MPPMQALSARVSSEDFEWLVSLDIPGANTPSDKVRALLQQLRKQHEGSADYEAALAWMRELVAPAMAGIGAFEHRAGVHSDLVRLMGEWAPQCMALLLASQVRGGQKQASAWALEEQLAQRAFQVISSVLRIAMPPDTDVYDPKHLNRHLPAALELASRISQERAKEKNDG